MCTGVPASRCIPGWSSSRTGQRAASRVPIGRGRWESTWTTGSKTSPARRLGRLPTGFTTRTGRPVEPRNLVRSFHRIIASHGPRPIRLHNLRRTTATLLKDLGVPPRDTMEILGHARIAVTMEIYTRADEASRRVALSKLSALFGPNAD